MNDIRRTVIWVILLGAGGLLVGCDQSPLVPFSEPSWDELRYHQFSPERTVELVLSRTGEISFSSKQLGLETERGGFLSRESIRELDRAVSRIEDEETQIKEPCEDGLTFFVSVVRDGSVFSFSGSDCESPPEGQAALAESLQQFVKEIHDIAGRAVHFRSMDYGRADLPVGLHQIDSLDDLTAILEKLSREGPRAWGPIDFGTEMVVGYVGEAELLDLRIGGVETTPSGRQIRIQVDVLRGIGNCPPMDGRPFEFVKFSRLSGDFVTEMKATETRCEFSK